MKRMQTLDRYVDAVTDICCFLLLIEENFNMWSLKDLNYISHPFIYWCKRNLQISFWLYHHYWASLVTLFNHIPTDWSHMSFYHYFTLYTDGFLANTPLVTFLFDRQITSFTQYCATSLFPCLNICQYYWTARFGST